MEEQKKDPFSFFDFTIEDVENAKEDIAKKIATKNGHVCICGHPMGRHSDIDRRGELSVYCTGNKGNRCQCTERRDVIKVDNARIFLRKTTGSGLQHALSQGIFEAVKAGQQVEWLIEWKCDLCKEAKAVAPCCVNERDIVLPDELIERDLKADFPTKYKTKMLCRECRLNN